MYYGGRKDSDPEYRNMLSNSKEGPMPSKPSDVRNGDLVSLLLAATPPYLYNMPLVPQSFFFSEMLRSFVQAKTERQNMKAHQIHRRRKRTWRESSPEKPLELTTPRAPEKPPSPPMKKPSPSCDFTAETLANSSVNPQAQTGATLPEVTSSTAGLPLWYPNTHPSQLPYPVDPLHFFIDLRVSAHIWDRKVEAEQQQQSAPQPESDPFEFGRSRHQSAFSVPEKTQAIETSSDPSVKNKQGVHYIMANIKSIYEAKEVTDDGEKDETAEEKEDKDLRALIGLEMVIDYVKQETDNSEEEEESGDDINKC